MKPYSRTRARDVDRDAAVEVVSAAYADGQLTSDEHRQRVSRLREARTFAELDAQLFDLQRPDQSLWRAPAMASGATSVGGGQQLQRPALFIGVLAAVLVVGFACLSVLGDDPVEPARVESPPPAEPEPITNPLTPQGWQEFLEALREKTGSTLVIEAYPYSDSVSVVVPVDETSERTLSYSWDGEWSGGGPGTDDARRKDLSLIEPEKFADAMARVSEMVDEPEDQSISIFSTMRDGACYIAAAKNRFGESEMGYFDCDGSIIPD